MFEIGDQVRVIDNGTLSHDQKPYVGCVGRVEDKCQYPMVRMPDGKAVAFKEDKLEMALPARFEFEMGAKVKIIRKRSVDSKSFEGRVGEVVHRSTNRDMDPSFGHVYTVKLANGKKTHSGLWGDELELANLKTEEKNLKFKVGDLVKCIDSGYSSEFEIGKTYKVLTVRSTSDRDSGGGYLTVELPSGRPSVERYFRRFAPAHDIDQLITVANAGVEAYNLLREHYRTEVVRVDGKDLYHPRVDLKRKVAFEAFQDSDGNLVTLTKDGTHIKIDWVHFNASEMKPALAKLISGEPSSGGYKATRNGVLAFNTLIKWTDAEKIHTQLQKMAS